VFIRVSLEVGHCAPREAERCFLCINKPVDGIGPNTVVEENCFESTVVTGYGVPIGGIGFVHRELALRRQQSC
jgi:hypothetical protein